MKKTIIIYGIALAGLVGILKFLEYRYFIRSLSAEVYIAVIALFFTAFGIWVGLKFVTGRKQEPVPVAATGQIDDFTIDEEMIKSLGISQREYEVLELIAAGHSNQEIANTLFVSISTIKTHSSNLFVKLDVKRRTQAVQKAKELRIIKWGPA